MREHRTKIVCIRFTPEEFAILESMQVQTGYRGTVSKKIRRALEPLLEAEKHRQYMKAQATKPPTPAKPTKRKPKK